MFDRLTAPRQRLVGSAFLMDMAVGAVGLGVQFTGVAFGAGPKVLGLLAALGSATYAIMCLLTSGLASRLGPRRTTRIAPVLLIVVWLLMARVDSIGSLLVLVVANGALSSFFWPSIMVWLASLTSGQARGLSRALGAFNVSWSMGLLSGAVLIGILWDLFGRNSFYCPIAVAAIILILLQITPGGRSTKSTGQRELLPTEDRSSALRGQQLLVSGRIATFCGFFMSGMILALFPKLGDSLGYSNTLIGWAAGSPYLSAMLIFAFSRTTTRWHYHPGKLWLAMPAGLAGMIIAARAQAPWQYIAGFLLAGLCGGLGYLSSQFYGLHGPLKHRSASMSHHEAAVGAGVVLGSILGGLLADYTGDLRSIFTLGAAVVVAGILAQLVAWHVLARRGQLGR